MSGSVDVTVFAVAIIVQAIGHLAIAIHKERRYQKTIDRLTDKLMARNYVEYKSMESVKEEDASPAPQREEETKGWYDH